MELNRYVIIQVCKLTQSKMSYRGKWMYLQFKSSIYRKQPMLQCPTAVN